MKTVVRRATLQDIITEAAEGEELKLFGCDEVLIEITGEATARTVVFEGYSEGGIWYPLCAVNMSTYDIASQTTAITNELWSVSNFYGITQLRTRVSSLTGACTVKVIGL